ncbi:hypothetical protein Pth03_44570 [Planotetraspora thailandica]|uniref:Golvesin/Xly CBD-like domain-containing protein n=2 Tax=Planotetraspora thailandica TaxID=487172 RepID=A0A8J3V254_9ACTN|nr:hypothetical protein Pth03_44570 [Planotetraspora thailandica]
MRSEMKNNLRGLVASGTVVAVLAGGLMAAPPARAQTPPVAEAGANWQPETRDLGAADVPRQGPLPKSEKAPPARRVKELTGRRTANAKIFQLADGRLQEELSATPMHYRDRDGKWHAIDATVRTTDREGFVYGNETNAFRSFFGTKPDQIVHFEAEGTELTLGAMGAKPGRPDAKGDTVTYEGALDGADLAYEVTPEGVKESIVLAAPPKGTQDASFDFAVRVKGLRAWQRPDGSIVFYKGDFDGPPVLVMPKPFMTDARDDASSPYGKAWSGKVSQRMRWDSEAGLLRITVTADRSWLTAPDRAYPVVIDPTVKVAPTPTDSQDVMILSEDPNGNYDSNWRLSTGTSSAGVSRSLLKFPLAGVPSGTKLDSAQLQVYYDQVIPTSTGASNNVTIEAHRATAPWDETTATWSNASNLTGELGSNTEIVDDGDAGKTAAVGAWPISTSTLAANGINGDYLFNKDAVAGESYTWIPRVTEDGNYRVDVHYVEAADRAANAPYTVTYNGGTKAYTVNQFSASTTNGVWKTLGTHPFVAGTTGKVTLGDGPATTSVAVNADAVRLTKDATALKPVGDNGSHWHSFSVRSIVQGWLDNPNLNYGFVLKPADETLDRGGVRYEGSLFSYGGETATYPRLVLTYGQPGVAVDPPTTIHATGAELSWPAYQDPSAASADDIVEYQVHRSVYQTFTPSAATLVAPVSVGTRSFVDTTATPTPADSTDPFGNVFYYMVAVKTKDGRIIPGPTQLAGLPKAGRVTKILQGGNPDTTLSSTQPDTNQDLLSGAPWLSVGNNSATFGKTRAVLKFPGVADIPATARVLDASLDLWAVSMTGSGTASYELRALTRDFAEATATWNKATSTTAWTTPGGDYAPTASSTVTGITNDPFRRTWNATSMVQGWVTTPTSNQGMMIKLANETSPAERAIFLSDETEEPQLRPQLRVTYIEKTTGSTYYAPYTPARLIPGDQYTVDVTVTNTTTTTWNTADRVISYRWTLPDGTDVTNSGNQLQTALPKNVVPGDTVTVKAQLKTPIQSDSGNKRTDYVLKWDLYNKTTGQWLSQSDQISSLDQSVAVEDPTSDQLGLEKFYSYAGKNTGAGGTAMTNLYAGNTVWSYNAFTNPGRGVSTFVRMAYNSQDTSASSMGYGWSLQASAPVRLGSPLDFHPNPNPTSVTMTDGDGTSHTFSWDAATSEWKAPAGVHYYLQRQVVCDSKTEESRAWVMTRPDRSQFFFDCDGYLSAIVDKNGNTQEYVYEQRHSNNKPIKFLRYITDPAGRQTLTVDYYTKGQNYTYIDDTGVEIQDTNLSDPQIIDQVESLTDISGRQVTFTYSDKGLMTKMVDGAGSTQPKVFKFGYDATQGNKNVKLVKVTDPRGHETQLAYYQPPNDDPKFHWWNKTITDRLGGLTQFAYTDPDGTAGSQIQTVVTDAESHASTYLMDGFGRPIQTTNAKNQTTTLHWDADNNVDRLQEPPATAGATPAVTTWTYDPKTGYPTETKDAEANKNGWAGTVLTYQTGLNGHFADLISKKSPEGRLWTFGYDLKGNLTSVTDGVGNTTTTDGDYTTRYEYDTWGQLTKATDANGHATLNSDFDPNGYPKSITDALGKATTFIYDERGQVLEVADALGKKTTQSYDVFGRPLENTVPKDQAAGDLITTPAPEYDANDNVVKATAPNGAVSTATYDNADEVIEATAPKDSVTSSERKSVYTYDMVGNLETVTEPKGALTSTNPDDYKTTQFYNEIYQLIQVTNAAGDKVTYTYDDVGNVTKVVDPKKNATADTTDFTTKTVYDLNHRITEVTDAAGKTNKRAYDRDSLVISATDAENNTTLISYDARGMQTQVRVPHDGASPNITYRTTKYEYDQVGNTTKVTTPRGVDTANADDFATRTEYDALNRPAKQFQPYDPADARYNNPNVYTQTFYDEVGRVSKTSLPPSDGQTVRNDTTYTYFDNGWVKSSTDPWDIVTTYDYNDLAQQTARTLTSAGGSSSRTMGWNYYPDGKLKSKTDDGVPVGGAVTLVDNSDTQNTNSTGTWSKGSLSGQQGYDHQVHAAGTGTDAFTWTLNIPNDGTYTAYVKFPQVTGAATTAKYTVTHSTGTTDKTISQATGAGAWVSLGTYTFTQGNAAKLQLFQNSTGAVVADGVKLVRDNSADTDAEKHTFAYGYDANGNLTSIDDTSPDAKIDAYTIDYTGLNQVQKVTEAFAGQEKTSTSYTYDANSQPETVTHPDQFSKYTYDLRELVKTVSVGNSVSDTSPKVTSYTYTDRGLNLRETKANGNTVDLTYYLDGALKTQTEKKPNGILVSSHTYAYDANGNKAQDVVRKMNADNHAAYLDSTTDYTYDPVGRLAISVKTGNGAGTETYVHDDNANVISQTVQRASTTTSTTFTYDRNRLLTSVTSGVTSSFNYDPFGRQESVTSGGQIVSRNVYDGFDHVVESQQRDGTSAMKSTTYTFDPLDRTASETVDGKTTDFTYLGLSSEVLNEEVDRQLTKSYQYSPWGERLSQVKHNSDGTTEDGYYGYNSHTDVETLTTKDGDTKATYGYTAYGSDDKSEFTGIDKPNAADPTMEEYNAYRFNAKRWDAQSGTYDMGFRDYNPGLNRFTTRDMYNGALADMGLGTDPFTGNRYAFTGGNPISGIEYDGHRPEDMTSGEWGAYQNGGMPAYRDYRYKNGLMSWHEQYEYTYRKNGGDPDKVMRRPGTKLGAAAIYDSQGKRIYFESGFFTGHVNEGMDEATGWDTHLEKRIVEYLKSNKPSLLEPGNTLVIFASQSGAPCSGPNGCGSYLDDFHAESGVNVSYEPKGGTPEPFGTPNSDGRITASDVFDEEGRWKYLPGPPAVTETGRPAYSGPRFARAGGRMLGAFSILGDILWAWQSTDMVVNHPEDFCNNASEYGYDTSAGMLPRGCPAPMM